MVLEYCSYDLAGLISSSVFGQRAQPDVNAIRWFLLQMVEGIHECHSSGLMHRDM